MHAYLGAVWKYRYFWLSLVKMDLRSRYRGSMLGMGWSLLHPIAMTAILCLAFGAILNMPWRGYAPFLMAGLTYWIYLTNVSLLGSHCFFQAECYIRQHPAPLAIYPLRTMLGNAFHFALGFSLVIALAVWLRGWPGIWPLLSLVPTTVLLLILGWALATVFGVINVRFGDTKHISELGFQSLFYVTPVMYEPKMLTDRGLSALVRFNPVVPFLEMVRQPLLLGIVPTPKTYAVGLLVLSVVVGLAVALLWREEKTLIFHL
jgi:ABC-type polysaccharide/polyol phosphate export permease